MKRRTIPIHQFDLAQFVDALVELWGDAEVAFPFVEGKHADFGTLCLGDAADTAGDSPLEWLAAGHTLFGQFARRDDCIYRLPGGIEVDVSDVDDDDDTDLDECSTYGFLVRLSSDELVIQTAVLSDSTGDCLVTAVKDAGLFETEMGAFIESLKVGG